MVRKELLFISPDNRFRNLAAEFETLSVPCSAVRVFFCAKWLPLLKL